VLVASGFSAQANASKLLEQGAAGFIGKQYHMQELLDSIRRVLEREAGRGGTFSTGNSLLDFFLDNNYLKRNCFEKV